MFQAHWKGFSVRSWPIRTNLNNFKTGGGKKGACSKLIFFRQALVGK